MFWLSCFFLHFLWKRKDLNYTFLWNNCARHQPQQHLLSSSFKNLNKKKLYINIVIVACMSSNVRKKRYLDTNTVAEWVTNCWMTQQYLFILDKFRMTCAFFFVYTRKDVRVSEMPFKMYYNLWLVWQLMSL